MQEDTCACGGEIHHGRRCRECFNRAHAEQQAARRAQLPKGICKCGEEIRQTSARCRKCNIAAIARSRSMLSGRIQPTVIAPFVPTSLRGEGGELLSEPERGLVCPFRAAAVEAILARRVGR